MEKKFQCRECKEVFMAKPVRKEYMSPIYGPCVSLVADCPKCNEESPEYVKPKPAKNSATAFAGAPPSCNADSCSTCPYS